MARGWTLVVVVSAACAACASATAAAEPPEEITFEVLHVAVDALPEYEGRARLDAVAEQLARAPVDVLCLQGIGAPTDRTRLKTALARVFPTSVDLPTDDASRVDDPRDATGVVPPPPSPPCKGVEAALPGVLSCFANVGEGCVQEDTIVIAGCLRPVDCLGDERFGADPERRCRSCIVGHARTGTTLTELASRCRDMDHPLSLNGQHGMMILSKLPLSRPSLYVLPSEGTRRAIVGATVTTSRGNSVDVFCASLGPTHDTALPTDPRASEPYPGPYGAPRDGWLRENELQVEQLVTHVGVRRQGRPAVVLGNFGASSQIERNGAVVVPASGRLGAERLEAAFAPGIAASYAPSCTICSENVLAIEQAIPSFDNRIYLAGLEGDAVVESTRSYLGSVVDARSRPVRFPLSMQFGFRSRIALPARR